MKGKRLDQLQFLRFIGFCFIFLFHALGTNLEPYFYSANSAYAMVSFFFILSGFGSGYSSADRYEKPTVKAMLLHQWKKIKKIYPVLFLSVIYCMLQTDLPSIINNGDMNALKESSWTLMKCLLMIQAWWNPYLHYNGVTWFISAIMFLYLFDLPVRYLLDKLHKNKREKAILTGVSVCLAIFIFLVAVLVRNREDLGYCIYAFPPSRLAEYLLGMCVGRMMYRVNDERKSIGNITLFSFLEGGALVLWVALFFLPLPVNSFSMQVYWLIPNILVLIIMGLGKGVFSNLFKMKPFQFAGNISMECYLLHQPILLTYASFVQMENTMRGTVFYIMFNFGFTILLSALLHRKSN